MLQVNVIFQLGIISYCEIKSINVELPPTILMTRNKHPAKWVLFKDHKNLPGYTKRKEMKISIETKFYSMSELEYV